MNKTTLDNTVENLRQKADKYQEATNFEAKLQEYTGDASSVQSSVYGLKSRLEEMERFTQIYTQVFEEDTPSVVEDARSRSQRVLDQTANDYWELIDDGEIDEYEQKVQSAKSDVNKARQSVRDELNKKQSDWEDRVDTGRRVLTLMSNTREAEQLLSDIETFVSEKMWDDSRSINSLQADWQGIQRKFESGTVADWDEFKRRHNLSEATINILKRLAEGKRVPFDDLNRSITDEILDVDDLRNVLEVTL